MGDAGPTKGTGYRLGAEFGGKPYLNSLELSNILIFQATFTDVCVFTLEGKIVRTKVPSTSMPRVVESAMESRKPEKNRRHCMIGKDNSKVALPIRPHPSQETKAGGCHNQFVEFL